MSHRAAALPRPPLLLLALAVAAGLAAAACRGGGGADDDGGGDPDGGDPDGASYPAPNAHLVPPVGGPGTIDVATWNIENFPVEASTVSLVADLIASLDLDLIAVEEISDVAAFDELLARLPDHAGVLSSHTYGNGTYQKVGFIYREGLIEVDGGTLLFESEGLDFPRPPLSIQVTALGHVFAAIVVHLKAGIADDDIERRAAALVTLEQHLRGIVDGAGDPDVIVLGDFNQSLVEEHGAEVWAPIVDDPGRYDLVTREAAEDGEVSYLEFGGILLDNVVTNAGFELGAATVTIPRLDEEPIGYADAISDHLPVVVSF